MALIHAGDCTVHYEEYGCGDTLLLLHGLLGSIDITWRRFLPDLAADSHVVAVDLRGHGRSDNPGGRLSLPILRDDLASVMHTLGIERADICGYGLGGYLGLAYGIGNPHRVRSLTMHAVKVFWDGASLESASRQMEPANILHGAPASAAALRAAHTPGTGPDGWLSLLAAGRELMGGLARDALSEREIAEAWFPVLVSGGDVDELVPPPEAARLAELLPAARHALLQGAGHGMNTVRKQDFLAVLRAFLARVRSGGDNTEGEPQ